ncbi:MAG: hypothetical protein JO359_03195 [Candidatus Eremiobacteraeota bacterium]|nr:hypothetical protein [Candidatus Eremiobacteraeota bacterium]
MNVVTMAAALLVAPVLAQTTPTPAPNFDGQYIGRRVSQDAQAACVSREGKVTFNVSGGKISTVNSGDTSAPVDASGFFTLTYDLTIAGVGPAKATFTGQIAGDTAKGTARYRPPSSTGLSGCDYTFSARKQ